MSKGGFQFYFFVVLVTSGLFCRSLSSFGAVTPTIEQPPATKVAIINQNNQLAQEAFTKIDTLPGYRLTNQLHLIGQNGQPTEFMTIHEVDAGGNSYTLAQTGTAQPNELYFVNGHTYQFDPHYAGWVDRGLVTPAEIQSR